MSSPPKTFLTPEQYLEIERAAEYKSEYFNGEMFAMAGAKANHNLIQLESVGCRLALADLYEEVEFEPGAPRRLRVRTRNPAA